MHERGSRACHLGTLGRVEARAGLRCVVEEEVQLCEHGDAWCGAVGARDACESRLGRAQLSVTVPQRVRKQADDLDELGVRQLFRILALSDAA